MGNVRKSGKDRRSKVLFGHKQEKLKEEMEKAKSLNSSCRNSRFIRSSKHADKPRPVGQALKITAVCTNRKRIPLRKKK